MIKQVTIDVAEFNRFWVTVEGKDIEEIKQNAREAVDRGEYTRTQPGICGVPQVEPFIHPINEEKFFHDPEKKPEKAEQKIPLGISERFGGIFCNDCTEYDLDCPNEEEIPAGWSFVYEEFKCASCDSHIAY